MRSQLTRIGSLFGNAPEIRAATAPAEARPRTAILQTPALDKHGHENHGWLTVRFVGFSLAAAPFTGEASVCLAPPSVPSPQNDPSFLECTAVIQGSQR